MKESFWGYWIVVLGISIISIMVLLQSYSTTNEQDYFLTKSVLEASMRESIDYGYYADTGYDSNGNYTKEGTIKMNGEKFVENFLRRFSEMVNINKAYEVNFYNIYEIPPAASVEVKSATTSSNFGIANTSQSGNVDSTIRLTGILYTTSDYNPNLPGGSFGSDYN
ncbi:MAG TPA: DUF5411 family protein [Bacilli bacterium]|jgi:hypothetical protein|nr:DUF5411 family protein [Bacilli bacterium]HPZ23315.1 DUF5411 family protein [Bacilli bacterium]